MPLDERAQQFLDALASLKLKPVEECTPQEARARTTPVMGESPAVERKQNWKLNTGSVSVPVRTYQPVGDFQSRVVFLHGGGWVFGTLDMYDQLCCWLCNTAKAEVWSVDYRLAPEHPFPAGLEDSLAVLNCALQQADGLPVVVVGDSAGANLATVAAMEVVENTAGLYGQVLVYPAVDCDLQRSSYQQFGEGHFLTTAMMEWFWGHYVADPQARIQPKVSPIRSQKLARLPKSFVLTVEYDVLRDEGVEYVEALKKAGVETEHLQAEGMIHGYLRHPNTFPQTVEHLKVIGQWIQQTCSPRK